MTDGGPEGGAVTMTPDEVARAVAILETGAEYIATLQAELTRLLEENERLRADMLEAANAARRMRLTLTRIYAAGDGHAREAARAAPPDRGGVSDE